jgi:protein-L-isoaspartate(D-aspartate) O-methyltransferase
VSELDFAALRSAMVDSQLRTSDVNDMRVVAAMAHVPREAFVPEARKASAYIDRSIPLGNGRALNPPLATGRLLTTASIEPGDKVLLIGGATGYTAAVLAAMGAQVTAVEQDALGVSETPGVALVNGPLAAGSSAGAPYDVLLIDGAIEAVPPALLDQVADGGRIVTGIAESGVTRLQSGRKVGNSAGFVSLFDMEMVALPGFEKPRVFAF